MKTNYTIVKNHQPIALEAIPVVTYDVFYEELKADMINTDHHCVAYYGFKQFDKYKFICAIAVDYDSTIRLYSYELSSANTTLASLTAIHYPFHVYEREIWENLGVQFEGHPWLKPIRYPKNRFDTTHTMDDYPFYEVDSMELHEVGVGPIHAGVIEPGHFRFICEGEDVMHLEIQLGYQHRGIESLMLNQPKPMSRMILAEGIAGDTVVGHGLAYVKALESLAGYTTPTSLSIERTIAMELERIAIHVVDLSAMCTDVAYQLGSDVLNVLRTPVINYFQKWCGNRFAKSLIRPMGTNYPLTDALLADLIMMLDNFEDRFNTMTTRLFELPSVLARFRRIGILTGKQAELIGAVGMTARISGLNRDIRMTHPYEYYKEKDYEYFTIVTGDVYARALIRKMEIERSITYIRTLITDLKALDNRSTATPNLNVTLPSNQLVISLIEGWRGEIAHAAITNDKGGLTHYKIKDPSFHNWMGLALAVRNQEISDFPICNKSFNLSYCGNDL